MNKNRNGQSLIEYMILVALIAIGTLGIVQIIGGNLGIAMSKIAHTIGGIEPTQAKAEKVSQEQYSPKDLGDFSDKIRNNADD